MKREWLAVGELLCKHLNTILDCSGISSVFSRFLTSVCVLGFWGRGVDIAEETGRNLFGRQLGENRRQGVCAAVWPHGGAVS